MENVASCHRQVEKKGPLVRSKSIHIFLYMFIIFCTLMCTYGPSFAQMTSGYPQQFHLTGLIELQYRNFETVSSYHGREASDGYSNFEQRIRLTLDGYIYHPRLIVFTTSVDFSYFKSLTGVDINGRDLGFDADVIALPYRPVSLELFASRSQDHFVAATAALPDITITHYGSQLRFNIEKIPLLRLIKLRYEHWDYLTEGVSEKTSTTTYSLDINGTLKPLNTNYTVFSSLSSFSLPTYDLKTKYFGVYTDTGLTKSGLKLLTNFVYTDFKYSTGDYDKELNFSADLDFPQSARFYHNYRYLYDSSEQFFKGSESAGTLDTLTKLSSHLLSGNWGYRLSDRVMSSLSLDYGKRTVNDEGSSVLGIGTAWTYRRPLAGMNFESTYRFLLRNDKLSEDFNEHTLDIGLTSKSYKWGIAYFNYTLIKSHSRSEVSGQTTIDSLDSFSTDTGETGVSTVDVLANTALLGIRGRGYGSLLRRAIWSVEASYYNVNSDIQRSIPTLDEFGQTTFTMEHIKRKVNQYSLYGQIILPIRTNMTFNSRAAYTFGETDSLSRKSFVMHARLNYLIFRNLTLGGLWRGRWDNIQGSPNQTTFDYEAQIQYRRARILATLEFYLTTISQGGASSQWRRIFFTIKRFI
jgi:hypothetical protein